MTTLPTWLVALLGLAGPFVAVVAIVADGLKERSRRKHERAMSLRDERLRAYSTLARVTKMVEASEEYQHKDLAEAHSEIELLTDSVQLRDEADLLVQAAA